MMNRFLAAAAAVLVSAPAFAAPSPEVAAKCKDARDFQGCVKAFTTAAPANDDALTPLRNAMKQVAARLRSGTSLRDSSEVFRPVVDQLAIVEGQYPDQLAVQKARLASRMFDALQLAWDTRIKVKSYGLEQYGMDAYNCKALKLTVENYNAISGAPYVSWDYKKGLFGMDLCRVSSTELPEFYIMRNVVNILDEGAVSPVEIVAQKKAKEELEAKAARERELCAMGPWNRYLEENPGVKKWAAANLAAADAAKAKYLANPKNQADCKPSLNYKWDPGRYNYFSQ
jgi:hypothetical protein